MARKPDPKPVTVIKRKKREHKTKGMDSAMKPTGYAQTSKPPNGCSSK